MTFNAPSAQPTKDQTADQFIARNTLGERPGLLVGFTIFTFFANVTLVAGLSLLVFHMQSRFNYIVGVWGGITPMFVFGFASSSGNRYPQRCLPNGSGSVGGHRRGLFDKPVLLSLVVAFGTIGIALSASAGFSTAISFFAGRGRAPTGMVITYFNGDLWAGVWIIVGFGIICLFLSIIFISISNRSKFISIGAEQSSGASQANSSPSENNTSESES